MISRFEGEQTYLTVGMTKSAESVVTLLAKAMLTTQESLDKSNQ